MCACKVVHRLYTAQMLDLEIRPIKNTDFDQFKAFTDQYIGVGYYGDADIINLIKASDNSYPSTFVLSSKSKPFSIHGVRVAFHPGLWLENISAKCLMDQWKVSPNQVGYFKSLFVSQDLQRQGWGPKLSEFSKNSLKQAGAKAIVCHAWKESPNNSSVRYLNKYGFTSLGEHPDFWAPVNYMCSGCNQKPCKCTAIEMILYL